MQLSTLHLADDSSSLVKHNVLLGRELEKHREVGLREGRTTETALVIPLDSLFHAETVALVKVDTQGSEENVLRGMQKILDQRPVIMYEETTRFTNAAGSAVKGVMAILRPLGYVCKSFCERWCSKARDKSSARCRVESCMSCPPHACTTAIVSADPPAKKKR